MKKFFQDKVLVAGFSVVLVTVLLLGGSWMLADEEKPLTLVQEVKHLREQVKEANRLREAKETELASEAEGSAKYRQEAVQLRSELAGMQARMKTAEARAAGWESARQLAAGDAVKAYQAEMEKLKADLIIAQAEKAAAVEQYKRAAGESAALQTHMDEWVKRQAFDPATTASVAALNELRAKLETSLKAREEADKEAGRPRLKRPMPTRKQTNPGPRSRRSGVTGTPERSHTTEARKSSTKSKRSWTGRARLSRTRSKS